MTAGRLSVLAIVLFFVAIVGCGSKDPSRLAVFPVKGQIAFRGKSPAGALVVLHPKTPVASHSLRPVGHVREDGTFSVTSYESDDGAPAGEYAVTVQWQSPVKKANGDFSLSPNVLPKQYSRPDTSPVLVHVAEGDNALPPIVIK
jgi:hypothetical protein